MLTSALRYKSQDKIALYVSAYACVAIKNQAFY